MKVNAGLDVERNEWIEVGHQAKNWEGRKSRSTTDKKKKGGLGRKERANKTVRSAHRMLASSLYSVSEEHK